MSTLICGSVAYRKKDQRQLWKWITWQKVGLSSGVLQVLRDLNAAGWNKLLLGVNCMNKTIHHAEKHPKVPWVDLLSLCWDSLRDPAWN